MRLRIRSITPNPCEHLASLDDSLNALLLAAEKGEWETIGNLSGLLIPALQAACVPAAATQQNIEKIRQTLKLLTAATEKCAERKEQIAPLVKALIPTKETPESE